MKAVWLSSTYYLDEAVQNLSPNAERMLTRALAYCGNAETSGYITQSAINMLGLPGPKKLIKELVDGDILIPQSDGRWYFDAWPEWNSSGDALLARRKSDRDRQARLREAKRKSHPESRDSSRETSRDVTAPEESRAEENSGYPRESATDSNGRGSAAATPGAELVILGGRGLAAVSSIDKKGAGSKVIRVSELDEIDATAVKEWRKMGWTDKEIAVELRKQA